MSPACAGRKAARETGFGHDSKGRRCRISPSAPHAVDPKQEPFSSEAGTYGEHNQNNPLHCKTENTADRWAADAAILAATVYVLTPENRLPLIELTFEHLSAGPPAFATDQDAADWAPRWVEIASLREQKFLLWAIFHHLPEHDRQAFLACVTGSGKAAA